MGIKVFGITGTNGKTTVSYMLRNILKESGKSCGLVGTISYDVGNHNYVPVNTTPGKGLLKELFQEMTDSNIENCVMEISSHGLDQGRIEETRIDFAGFTNLTQDHLDYHKTMEDYYQAKRKLFYQSTKANIINIDDNYGKKLWKDLRDNPSETAQYSCTLESGKGDFSAKILELYEDKVLFKLWKAENELGKIFINMPGEHSVKNALLAAAMASVSGVCFEDIKRGLENLKNVPGRFEFIKNAKDYKIVVDYAHTPDALECILETAGAVKKGRLICVFGCGGNRDRQKRQIMGKVAGTYSDYSIITSDNPRNEEPKAIANDIEEGMYETNGQYEMILDRYEAIRKAIYMYRKGDIIVIAGKGHEADQIVGEEKRPFDDRGAVKEILEGVEPS